MSDHIEPDGPRVPGTRHRADPVWNAVVTVLAEQEAARPGSAGNVVDVGGGSGAYAVRIARRGHRVTVIDPSANALATLQRRAMDAGVADRVVALQGDIDGLGDLIPAGTAELVLCHGVLEVVDDPAVAVRQLATVAAPGAAVSVVVANRHGAVTSRVVAGHLAEALAILRSPDGSYGHADPLPRRFTVDTMRDGLVEAGLTPLSVRGVRTFGDILSGDILGDDAAVGDPASLATIDDLVAGDPAFQSMAPTVHVVARRP